MIRSSYGDIPGSQSSWSKANFRDQGRRHNAEPSLLSQTGIGLWNTLPSPGEKPMRKIFPPRQSPAYAEPVVFGSKATETSYFERRAQTADCDYRRSMRQIPDPGPLRIEKQLGKKAIPEPKPSGMNAQGKKQIPEARFKESDRISEPSLPRLGRPEGISSLRESVDEFNYERAFGRKIIIDPSSLKGRGYAGDKTGGFGPKGRPEDDPFFFKTLKDTPTFIRFCSSLNTSKASSAVSSHERRAFQQKREKELERERMQAEVATLTFEVSDD